FATFGRAPFAQALPGDRMPLLAIAFVVTARRLCVTSLVALLVAPFAAEATAAIGVRITLPHGFTAVNDIAPMHGVVLPAPRALVVGDLPPAVKMGVTVMLVTVVDDHNPSFGPVHRTEKEGAAEI